MTEEPKLVSKNTFGCYLFILVVGGALFGAAAYFLITTSMEDEYPNIIGLAFGTFFGIFSLAALVSLWWFDTLIIYNDRLVIKSILGNVKKVIYLSDIVGWTEIDKQNEHIRWTDLTVYTERTCYKISSSLYGNYIQLRALLVHKKPRDIVRQNNWFKANHRAFGVAFVIISAFMFYAAYHFYMASIIPLNAAEITIVSGTITNKVEIDVGPKGSRSIEIHLKEFPGFEFQISGNAYGATYSHAYVQSVHIGDTLYLEVKQEDAEMKLLKRKPLGFIDKYVDYHFISVYGLCDNHQCYLTLSDYNKETQSDAPFGIVMFAAIGLFVLGSGVYQFIAEK